MDILRSSTESLKCVNKLLFQLTQLLLFWEVSSRYVEFLFSTTRPTSYLFEGATKFGYVIFIVLQAHVFSSQPGVCVAFLANYNPNSFARIMFNNMHYNLPPWSISILPDCRNVVFNTAMVSGLAISS